MVFGEITNREGRELNVSLSFLNPTKKYIAEIYTDGKEANYKNNPYPINISKKNIDSDSKLTLKLAPGGGTAIKISLIE